MQFLTPVHARPVFCDSFAKALRMERDYQVRPSGGLGCCGVGKCRTKEQLGVAVRATALEPIGGRRMIFIALAVAFVAP